MSRYPLHQLFAPAISAEREPVRLCAATMILPEQLRIKLRPTTRYLYCIGCSNSVEVTPEERAQAECAAVAEGFAVP